MSSPTSASSGDAQEVYEKVITGLGDKTFTDHSCEVVSDAGEGAQKCGQGFGALSAKMGNGAWTVEIIPAEIEPPPRTPGSTSGVGIRIGQGKITNAGDAVRLAIAFNEQVLLSRHRVNALADDCVILIDSKWKAHPNPKVVAEWDAAMEEMSTKNYQWIMVPLENETLKIVQNPKRGKNMFALGILCHIYDRDVQIARDQIAYAFRKKAPAITEANHELIEAGIAWAAENLDFRFLVPATPPTQDLVVMNGNEAFGMGALAAGIDVCAMYPITPASSVSHYLADVYDNFGGMVHQAEDEIAAIGVALGSSYSGKTAMTVTSGPGLALKGEFIGFALMTEIPLIVIDVQRGGPSTGLPTKVEQSDLLCVLYGQPGDGPKVVIAPSTIEECFHIMVTAREIAETLRTTVFILSDANLATGQTPFERPKLQANWMAGPPRQTPLPEGARPYEWNLDTGISERFIPGQRGGEHTVTGLNHDEASTVNYEPQTNELGHAMRSRKIAVLSETLAPPEPYGGEEGDILIIGWGSTRGAIEEAVDRARAKGLKASSLHLTFLSPLQPGIRKACEKFKKIMAVEINYSDAPDDPHITHDNRRRGQLATLLRGQLLIDCGSWGKVPGAPLQPELLLGVIEEFIPKA
ncbi:MAG: 2-oxoacid:acceptor oxidoreductase subunit alpha [Planctomycetota bacterium]|nr:2-oxoacid:acceptor oxidoreductase subunit alpha [Planctomycetota bacterium]